MKHDTNHGEHPKVSQPRTSKAPLSLRSVAPSNQTLITLFPVSGLGIRPGSTLQLCYDASLAVPCRCHAMSSRYLSQKQALFEPREASERHVVRFVVSPNAMKCTALHCKAIQIQWRKQGSLLRYNMI